MQDNVEICTKTNLRSFFRLYQSDTKNDELKDAEFTSNIEQDWRITSFTSIEQAHRRQKIISLKVRVKNTLFLMMQKDYDSQKCY